MRTSDEQVPPRPTGIRARKVRLSSLEASRAICIDFEGTASDPASFLGFYIEGVWEVVILEPELHAAVVHHPLGTLRAGDPVGTYRSLQDRARLEDRRIVAWSNRELDEIVTESRLTTEEQDWWRENLVNALPPAKSWANRAGVSVPSIRSNRGGRENKWSLSGFRQATGYGEISTLFEPGNTASRIRAVRQQLEKKGTYGEITPVVKAKWSKVLTHNFHDCAGLAHVVQTVFAD
jgi:hypothetical protein